MRIFPVPARIGWLVCALVGIADAALIHLLGFSVATGGMLLRNLLLLLLLGGFSAFYASRPLTHRLALFTSAILFIAVYSIAIVLLSYLTAAADLPLADRSFVAMDRALGFDWQGWLAWVSAHPDLGTALAYAYESSMPQVVLALAILAALRHRDALSEYLSLFWLTTVATILLAALLPAAGAYEYLKPDPHLYGHLSPEGGIAHIRQFLGLRDGSFRTIDLTDLNGLVAFPSFHTALAVITAWSLRQVPLIRYPAFLLNGLVILSTPTQGGHYLVDIVGGGMLAAACILLHRAPVRAALAASLSPRRPFSRLAAEKASHVAGEDAGAHDEQSIRTRPRPERGQSPVADAAFLP